MHPLLAVFSSPLLEWNGDGGDIGHVTLHLLWPMCGSKENSALAELFLTLSGSACVASGAVGSEGDEGCGGLQMERQRLQ